MKRSGALALEVSLQQLSVCFLVHVVLLVGGLGLGVGHVTRNELAELGLAVLARAAREDGLRLLLLGVVTSPRLEHGVLQRARVREGHVPGVRGLVHGVQVEGGVELGEAAGEEHDAGSGGGHARVEHAQGVVRHLLRGVARGAVGAGADHGGLEQHALEGNVVVREVLERLSPHPGGNLEGLVDAVLAVEQDLGLDNGHEAGILHDGGVAGEAVRAVGHRGAGGAVGNGHDGAPLAEARTLLVVRGGAIGEVIEALAPGLVRVGEGTEALVHLDTRVDVLGLERIHEGGAVRARLVQSLLEEDGTADVLAKVRGGDKELAVAATVLLDVLDTDTLETGAAGGVGLVHGEDTLAGHGHLGLRVESAGDGSATARIRRVPGKRARSRARSVDLPETRVSRTAVSRSSSACLRPALVTTDARLGACCARETTRWPVKVRDWVRAAMVTVFLGMIQRIRNGWALFSDVPTGIND